jgi:O-acetyl-ADP-ribose deacetylase (regulator of RNase III)
MSKQAMQFLFGDRELQLRVADLLSISVDVIVNPANTGLSHVDGLSVEILQQAGEALTKESEQFIREHGQLESGMAVYTTAGNLPYKAVVHAVSPVMGEGDEQYKIEQVVGRALRLCEINEWQSIAFPALGSDVFNVPVEISARGFFRAITSYWDARIESSPEKIVLCLSENDFRYFFDAFRGEAVDSETVDDSALLDSQNNSEPAAGIVDLSEEDVPADDDEINDWFK